MRERRPLPDGYDRIGPFHPFVVIAAIVLLDLVALLLIIAALTFIGDKIEDLIWPGGREWVDL